jgi:hypothetical protein
MDASKCTPIDATASGCVSRRASFNNARNLTSAAMSTMGAAELLTEPQMARSNIQAGRSRPLSPSTPLIVQRKTSPLVRSLASRTRTTNPDHG